MATITITDSASTNAFLLPDELGSELTIGTAESCSIPLPAVEGLSSCHCRIVRLDDGYALSDAGSENGTYADDRPVESEYMVPGVLYRIGAATMVYDDGGTLTLRVQSMKLLPFQKRCSVVSRLLD